MNQAWILKKLLNGDVVFNFELNRELKTNPSKSAASDNTGNKKVNEVLLLRSLLNEKW